MDDESGRIILPNDPFWLLNVEVKEGDPVPFNAQMLYAYQYRWGSFVPHADLLLGEEPIYAQADGVR